MTTFQISSDLHIEYKNDRVPDPLSLITPSADILILAGDIGSLYKYKQLKTFLEQLCLYFKAVLYVPGNHEYYKLFSESKNCETMTELSKKFIELERNIDNLYILDKSSVMINDVCIVGCTLWSKPKTYVPPYICRIHEINTNKYNEMFNEHLEYIKKMMKYCYRKQKKLLVITHHCPTYSVMKGKKKKDKFVSLYASDLDYLLRSEFVHTWVCGHIHENFDFITKNGTRVVGNQLGKPKDKIKDYRKDMNIIV